MKLLINAGNQGNPMGSATAELIKLWGFDGVRTSLPLYAPEANLAAIISELADNRLEALLIVGGWEVWIPHYDPNGHEVGNTKEARNHNDVAAQASAVTQIMKDFGCVGWIECGNEPDITQSMNTQRFVDQCQASLQAVREVNPMQPFITGGVSNLGERNGLKYLRRCLDQGLITGEGSVFCGVHPYRTHLYPWDLFEGRPMADILADVRNEAGPFAITEIGWHTATQQRKAKHFFRRERFAFTDIDVKDFAEWDLDLGLTEGSELYTWYQLNSGPGDDALSRYGIREFDTFNKAKPVVETFKNWSPPI